MHTPHLLLPAPGSTPTNLKRSRDRRSTLPPDLLREASLRLGIMSLLGAVLWTLGTVLGHIAFQATDRGRGYFWFSLALPTDAIAGASIIGSLALFIYTRRSRRDPGFILDVGLAYMVLMALALGLMFHLGVLVQRDSSPATRVVRPEIS